MAYYTCLLMDVDNTLLDFDSAERQALADTMAHYELPCDADSEIARRSTASCGRAWQRGN